MSGPIGTSQLMYSAAAGDFYSYQIANSLRNSAAQNGTLKFTAGTPSSTDVMTFACWFKRHTPNETDSAANNIITTGTGGGNYFFIAFGNQFHGENAGGNQGTGYLLSHEKFRDSSAWYHLIFRVDTSQGTQFDRIRVYINGQQLGLDTIGGSAAWRNQTMITNTTQNEDFSYFNADGLVQAIGGLSGKGHGTEGADLTIADVQFFDGQSYYSELGETKNGVWIPKDPSGLTFGNNGYWLKFADSSSIGTDSSGNGNDFTVANFAAHDVLLDSPTFGSEGSANFPAFFPLYKTQSTNITDGNLDFRSTGNIEGGLTNAVIPAGESTVYYFEAAVTPAGGGHEVYWGVNGLNIDMSGSSERGGKDEATCWAILLQPSGHQYLQAGSFDSRSEVSLTINTGDIIGMVIDRANTTIKWYINNVLKITSTNLIATGDLAVWSGKGGGTTDCGIILNAGQDGTFCGTKTAQGNADSNGFGNFFYSPPLGVAYCSGNLPIAAGVDPAETDDDYSQKAFDVVTYVGNGQARTISTNFKADNIWVKDMDSSRRHYLVTNTINANFGTTSYLHPSNAVSEGNSTDGITASAASTFTIGGSLDYVNNNTNNYVSYLWRVNGGTTSALNAGDINATGQINQTHGCGVLLYTGDGGSSNVTMAHGMGSKPEFLWMKDRDSNGNNNQWGAWHTSMQDDYYMYLSDTAAEAASSNGPIDTSNVTDSLLAWLRTSTSGGSQTRFENGDNFIIYQFVGVEGHSKFGSYEGNGNADGAFVYTGFSPAFVMVKSIDSTSDWEMYDNVRAGYNENNDQLEVNDEAAQDTGTFIDLLSNGFKMRASGDPNVAETYIYAAWAHNSSKYATAR